MAKTRKRSSGIRTGSGELFYREVNGRHVSYEFNATYRKPSDSGWVSEDNSNHTRPKSFRKKSDTESESKIEKVDIFDIASAKRMSNALNQT